MEPSSPCVGPPPQHAHGPPSIAVQRLTREHRLRRRAQYVRVQSMGVRLTTEHFVFLLARRPDRGPSRLGVTASKRIGCAAVRNRAKRSVKEAFRHMPGLLPDGLDMVVVVRRSLGDCKVAQVQNEWAALAPVLQRRARALLRNAEASP